MAQLVARFVRDEEAFGSSPNTPTNRKDLQVFLQVLLLSPGNMGALAIWQIL